MQVSIPFRALVGGGGSGFNANGGTLTTPLVLSGNPIDLCNRRKPRPSGRG